VIDAPEFFAERLLAEYDLTPPLGLGALKVLCRALRLRVVSDPKKGDRAAYYDGSHHSPAFRAVFLGPRAGAHELAHEIFHHLVVTSDDDLLAGFKQDDEERLARRFAELVCAPPEDDAEIPLPAEPPPVYCRRAPESRPADGNGRSAERADEEADSSADPGPDGVDPNLLWIVQTWAREKQEDDERRRWWRGLGR
jgi:hypothetical protein